MAHPDPALVEAPLSAGGPSPALVVHKLRRPEPRFVRSRQKQHVFADPADVLLDLHELRLIEQADDFISTMLGGGPRP